MLREALLVNQVARGSLRLLGQGAPVCSSLPARSRMSGFAALHESAHGRLCCKSLKMPGDKFPARSRNKPGSLIDVASGSLPKSPVSLSPGDEVPHMFTRKPRLQLEIFAMNGAKRLLQHNRHFSAVPTAPSSIGYRGQAKITFTR